MISKYILYTLLLCISMLLLACNNTTAPQDNVGRNKTTKVTRDMLDNLAGKRIYFGHMSVGNNIIQGIEEIITSEEGVKLAVRETENLKAADKGTFAHSPIGDNMHPLKKINNFSAKMTESVGHHADIAFFKFCYIDMMADQDVDKIFSTYTRTLNDLKLKYPQTTFIHVTVPLTVVQTGWKVPVKKLIGKAPGGYLDNIERNRFNQKLISAYAGKEPVFDLARVEATRPDGSMVIFKWEGKTYLGMLGDYASDGRHLNAQGRRYTAEQLLVFLANI